MIFEALTKEELIVLLTQAMGRIAGQESQIQSLQAVTVHTRLAPDEWLGTLRQRADDATGDAAGDLFGIDIGL